MKQIIPAIIPESLSHLESTLEQIQSFAEEIQIDIVDGEFVPFKSWPYRQRSEIDEIAELIALLHVEVDLMIQNPEEVIGAYVESGVKDVVVHLESTTNFQKILSLKNELGFRLGLSINNDSPLEMLLEHIQYADYVQLMGIAQIGSQGQPFDERVLERVREIRRQYPSLTISIDGSVNKNTIPQLRDAGANRFVSGSAILKSDNPEETFRVFEAIARD